MTALAAGSLALTAASPQRYQSYDRITGTYQLDTSRGDNPQRAAEQATRTLPPDQRDRTYQRLIARLDPPATIALDENGPSVTMASTRGPRVTFDADGQPRSERGPNGNEMTTRAQIQGNRLIVSTTGNRGSDYDVTFESTDRGNGLTVTRRFDSENLSAPITVRSFYRRVSNDPRWDLYAENAQPAPAYGQGYNPPPPPAYAPSGYGGIPEGTRLVATLDTPLSTRDARDGQRFTMTVRSPGEFAGARIDGFLSRVNGYGRDRAGMMVNFDTIRLRNGETVELRAILDSARTPDGQTLRIDREGAVGTSGTTEERVQHGAIGAAIGAVIGAVIGGGKGAAAGALVGGGAGAIMVEGRDQLDLAPGTEVTLTVAGPR